MNTPTVRKTVVLFLTLALLVATASFTAAREQQLAGMRLGQHAINLLDVYGPPDGIVIGAGPAAAGPSAAQMGMGPGLPGFASPLMAPPAAAMGMMGGVGAPPPPGMAGPPPPGGVPPGPGAFPGMPGAPGAPGALGAAGVGVAQAPFPIWALAVWVELAGNEVEWIYNKGPVVLGFVLDRDGYVNTICVVGEECGYARSALWRPHQYVKLGDDFKRVLYRYGYPDDWITFDSTGPGETAPYQGQATVSFGGTSRIFSRDVILLYNEGNNIAFTLHNMKVTRMHIWRGGGPPPEIFAPAGGMGGMGMGMPGIPGMMGLGPPPPM